VTDVMSSPAMRKPTRSDMFRARSRSWVTTMLVTLYSFFSVAMISLIVADITGSSSLVGSS
jgi:hypothetical protein